MRTLVAKFILLVIFTVFVLIICGHIFVVSNYKRPNTNNDTVHVSGSEDLDSTGFRSPDSLSLDSPRSTSQSSRESFQSPKKLILLWTPKFGVDDWLIDSDLKNCVVRCEVTADKNSLNRSDAIIFHGSDSITFDNVNNFPRFRQSWQRWVYFGMESPPHTLAPINTCQFNGVFNWTMSYRRDADIVVGFGSTHKLEIPRSKKEHWMFKKVHLRPKARLALARISHCQQISNHRMDYIRELKKYMDVDVYGECGDKLCPKGTPYCDYKLPKLYKFFLAFENSCCHDYITEKFWLPLGLFNSIPVVIGGAKGYGKEYELMGPPNSFINAAHFSSAKQLAAYLLQLDTNQRKYERYFEWKKSHSVKYHNDWCLLCEALHDKTRPVQASMDFKRWYEDDECRQMEPRSKRDKCVANHIK